MEETDWSSKKSCQLLKVCTNPPFTTIYHDFCTELINGFPRVTIEILMRDQLISYQRVRHLLWRSYATTPGLSTGSIWSEIYPKIAIISPKMLHLAFAPVILCRNFWWQQKWNFWISRIFLFTFDISNATMAPKLVILRTNEVPALSTKSRQDGKKIGPLLDFERLWTTLAMILSSTRELRLSSESRVLELW